MSKQDAGTQEINGGLPLSQMSLEARWRKPGMTDALIRFAQRTLKPGSTVRVRLRTYSRRFVRIGRVPIRISWPRDFTVAARPDYV
jgi:hypothetical protein